MIRTFFVVLLIVLYLVFGLLLELFFWIVGKFNKPWADRASLACVQWIFKVLLFIAGVKVEVKGLEHVPDDQAVLYIGNHRSYFDIVTTYCYVKGLCGFMAKKEMEKIPLLSNWMRHLYCLFLDRDNVKEGLKTILTAIEQVKAGISIFIFPEGTRSQLDNYEMLPFREGSLKIAEKTGCPVIPVAIKGTAEILENHFPSIKPSHVTIQFGEPIDIKGLPKEQKKFAGAYIRTVISDMLKAE
ncbi:MAG: lysophospholipid acyltransferase family protein [Lachnospiraceae bacterium]